MVICASWPLQLNSSQATCQGLLLQHGASHHCAVVLCPALQWLIEERAFPCTEGFMPPLCSHVLTCSGDERGCPCAVRAAGNPVQSRTDLQRPQEEVVSLRYEGCKVLTA